MTVTIRAHLLLLCFICFGSLPAADLVFGPDGTLYPKYLADPRRPQSSAALMLAFDSDLEERFDTGSARFDLKLGERIRVLRWRHGEHRLEFAVEAAFFGQFDIDHDLDNIGWDGWYGMNLAWRRSERWAVKAAFRHESSHLGDEFIERTGRARINYTREDLTLGFAWTADPDWQAYVEAGYGTNTDGKELQEPGFLQLGWQWHPLEHRLWDRWRWRLAVDSQHFEENDWEPGLTLHAGVLLPAERSDEGLIVGLSLYTGRAILGEFSRLDESYLSLHAAWDF